MLLCDISHVYFPISSLAYMRKKYFSVFFSVVRCCLLYVGWWKKDFVYHYIVCVHVCTCDRENEYMLVRNGLVNVSLDWGSWQLFIVAVFASPIAQKSLDYTFIDPTKKNGISYSLSPYCQMKMKKKKKNTRKMKNLAKIHRIHEKSRECEENWKWNKAHVVTLPATWAWICMLSLYVNEWLTPNTGLLYQFLIAFFRICVGDYFCKWFYCFLYVSDFFSPIFFFHSLWNSEKNNIYSIDL